MLHAPPGPSISPSLLYDRRPYLEDELTACGLALYWGEQLARARSDVSAAERRRDLSQENYIMALERLYPYRAPQRSATTTTPPALTATSTAASTAASTDALTASSAGALTTASAGASTTASSDTSPATTPIDVDATNVATSAAPPILIDVEDEGNMVESDGGESLFEEDDSEGSTEDIEGELGDA